MLQFIPSSIVAPVVVVLAIAFNVVTAAERPNVVLIITDDQGYGDLGVTDNPVIKTPNIDRLAEQSAGMANFYVSPVCAPTRACLMTGRYNYRTRCIDTWIGRAMMDPAEITVAEILADAGYATGIFGKWHLGDCYPMRPNDQGFQQSLIHRGGGIGQPSDPPGAEGKYTDPVLFRNGEAEQMKGYCTDVYYENAMNFIEQCQLKDQPFFVYLPDNCPHAPFHDVPQADYELYKNMDLSNDRFPQGEGHPLPKKPNLDTLARIYAMITNIDRNVGRLCDKLDALKLADNTILIFMVDNGPNTQRYVAGYRGAKTQVYEGGIRSPLFVRWPARLQAGLRATAPSAHIDVLPTLLDACDVPVPDGLQLDGRSMLLDLRGAKIKRASRTLVIQSHRGDQPVRYHNFAARDEMWKLLHASGFGTESFNGKPKFELYNLAIDPLEMNNVADLHPEVVQRMKQRYDAWFDDVSSTRPDNFAPPRIVVGTPHENPTVLTRQDWRHTEGRPWSRDSIGHWLLTVAQSGKYELHCRFEPADVGETAVLTINDLKREVSLPAGSKTCVFKDLELREGDIQLEVILHHGEDSRGVHQADLNHMP